MIATTKNLVHRLDRGLLLEVSQLGCQVSELEQLMKDARLEGEKDSRETFAQNRWESHWKTIEGNLRVLREFITDVRLAVDAVRHDRRSHSPAPSDKWIRLQAVAQEVELQLAEIGDISSENLDTHGDIWELIITHISVIRSHVRALHLELDLRGRYFQRLANGVQSGNMSFQTKVTRLQDSEHSAEEYKRAVEELDEEKQQFGGFFDVLKALFVYQESPRERAAKIHAAEHG